MFGRKSKRMKRIDELEAEVGRLWVCRAGEADDASIKIANLTSELNDRREGKEHLKLEWNHERDIQLKNEAEHVRTLNVTNSDLRQCNTQLNQRNIALRAEVAGLQDELVSLNDRLESRGNEVKRLAGRLNRGPGTSEPRMYRTDSGLQENIENMEVGIRALHAVLDQRDATIEKLQKRNVSLMTQVQTPIYIVAPAAGEDVVASLQARIDRDKDLSEKLQKEVDKRSDAEERLGYSRRAVLEANKRVEDLKRALSECRSIFMDLIHRGTAGPARKGKGVADEALND